MPNQHESMQELLQQLQTELTALGLWQKESLPEEAFLSEAPFCIDTMEFHQWLQFIFIPKMHALIAQQQPLPSNMTLHPLAEEFFKDSPLNTKILLTIIRHIDSGAKKSLQ